MAMDYNTEGPDLSVREFYNLYKKQLPKIVLINQGFYDEAGNDTFSREQVLRLHTTAQRKRVLVRSYGGIATKTYSMSINYPEKFCMKSANGEFNAEQSLLSIVRAYSLPVIIRLPRDRTTVVNNQHVRTNDLPEMEMIKTFDEISFLANDIENGLMTPEVLKIPLCIESVRFKLVTGLNGQSKRIWQEFNNRLNVQTKGISYKEELGVEDIAQYRESQVTEDADISRLEPAFYVNLSVIASSNSVSNQKPQSPNDDNTYKLSTYKESNKSELKTNLMKEIASAVVKTGKGFKESIATSKAPPNISQKPLQNKEVGAKPKTAPKPPKKLQNNAEQRKIDKSEPNANETRPRSKPSEFPFGGSRLLTQVKDQSDGKIYNTQSDHNKFVDGRPYYNTTSQVEVYSRIEDKDDLDPSSIINVYENIAIIPPLSNPEGPYVQTRERHNSGILESNRATVSSTQQSLRCNLTPEDIAGLSINGVSEYLKLLKLDSAIDSFRENQVDGKLLTMLSEDILKEEFHLKSFQVLKLQNFVRGGHIPR